jgi:serine/threonine-protein kinase
MEPSFPGLSSLEALSSGPVRLLFRAEQTELNRKVLVICLAPGVRPDSALGRGLRREAEAYARLDHPHVPQLHDLRVEEDRAWFVLSDCGEPLDRRWKAPLPWTLAAALGLQLSSALAHAHSRDQIHGRLGLEHVFFSESRGVQLTGFGLSPDSQDVVEPLELGSTGRLSPEVALGQPPSPASDVFAFGALLFELVSGQAPFSGTLQARHHEAPALGAVVPGAPAEIEELLRRCLSRLPGKRPESILEVQQQLGAFLGQSADEVIARALARGPESSKATSHRPRALAPALSPLSRGLLLGLSFGALTTGTVVWWRSRIEPHAEIRRDIDLTPIEKPLSLRAVASPWAHVVVDGVLRETTPFSNPIRLQPGKHEVRFEHPRARTEIRHIEGGAGESIFLDVSLRVERPLPSGAVEAPPDDSP